MLRTCTRASLLVALFGAVTPIAGAEGLARIRVMLNPLTASDSTLAQAIGRDFKGKASLAAYVVAIPLSFVHEGIACAIYALVALIWFVPDPRIERRIA
jgi:hypothetical protein